MKTTIKAFLETILLHYFEKHIFIYFFIFFYTFFNRY